MHITSHTLGLLYVTYVMAVAVAFLQLLFAFVPRFSVAVLGNALLLLTIAAPLALDGTVYGRRTVLEPLLYAVWFGNVVFLLVLLTRWVVSDAKRSMAWPVLGSFLGLLAFGLHGLIITRIG